MAPTDYVSDYEYVTGMKPDGAPLHPEASDVVETKVIAPPAAKKIKAPKSAEAK